MTLSTLPEKDFFGRKDELTTLYRITLEAEKGITQSSFLSGPRGIGKTELLKQLYNHLFWEQERVIPFYYCVNNGLLSVPDFSIDYLSRFICQRLAFENKDASLLGLFGLSLERLSLIAELKRSRWALELLDRYSQSTQRPIDSLRIVLGAPHQSAISTGKAMIVMIDGFQRLKNLRIQGTVDSTLMTLFEEPFSSKMAPHIITGNQSEIEEILFSHGTFAGNLQRIDIGALKLLDDSILMFSSLLDKFEVDIKIIPDDILAYLKGNPLYIKCMAIALRSMRAVENNFWKIFFREVSSGNLYLYWSEILKSFFPVLGIRRKAIEIINKINTSDESFTQDRISRFLSLSAEDSESILKTLYLSGLVTGEFGIFRVPEDRVLRDFMDCLYMREILEKPLREIEEKFLERVITSEDRRISFEMTIPMVKEAELVAVSALEQIGKNMHLNPEIIGQLQVAVIEGCINAIEHSRGEGKKIYLSFNFNGENLTVSIESPGREFISPEVGEPFSGFKEGTGRGWGVRLMKSFADSVRFEKTERGTKVVLVKNLKSEVSAQGGKDPGVDE